MSWGPKLCFLALSLTSAFGKSVKEDFVLNIIHVNDLHAHFDAFNKNGLTCSASEFEAKECYGGLPRLTTKVKELMKTPNSLFLNAGDFFQGTLYYSIFKGDVVREMGNLMNMDAFALGNHEFDDGVTGLLKLTKNATFKILACNIDASKEPEFAATISKSVVVEVGGKKIGIIGYVTENTPILSSPGTNLTFLNEIESIQKEADYLISTGVNIIIATGHSGYSKDMEIAAQVKGVDLVVGAHSHSFLWPEGETLPAEEQPIGPYPTVVDQENGSGTLKVPVVQAYAYGKYVGKFMMHFDDDGVQTGFMGRPILIDQSIEEDAEIVKALAPYSERVESEYYRYIGKTNVFLNSTGSMQETNMGNLIADSMIDWVANEQGLADLLDDSYEWTRAAIAVNNDGGIRASIDDQSRDGNITSGDIRSVIPFENELVILDLSGKLLKEALEHAVKEPSGAFLQVAGLKIDFDIQLDIGRRATQIYVRCQQCRVPSYEPLNEEKIYKVAMYSFLASGGDGYAMFKNATTERLGIKDFEVFEAYVAKISPVNIGIEGRSRFVDTSDKNFGATLLPSLGLFVMSIFFAKIL